MISAERIAKRLHRVSRHNQKRRRRTMRAHARYCARVLRRYLPDAIVVAIVTAIVLLVMSCWAGTSTAMIADNGNGNRWITIPNGAQYVAIRHANSYDIHPSLVFNLAL